MEQKDILEVGNCAEEVVEVCENPVKLGNTTIFKASMIGLGVAAAGATIWVIVRNRKKRKKKTLNDLMVERLEKKGYTVVPPLDDCSDESVVSEDN